MLKEPFTVETDVERRCSGSLELRVSGGKPTLVGVAVPFDSPSEELPWGFVEIIERDAFTAHLSTNPSIAVLREHDPRLLLAKTPDTLTLDETDAGVRASFVPPDSELGRSTIEDVRRGALSQFSFAMVVKDDRFELRDGVQMRFVERAELIEISPVVFPSYPTTSLAVRSRAAALTEEHNDMPEQTIDKETAVKDVPAETTTAPAPEKTEPAPAPERRSAPIATVGTSAGSVTEWRDARSGREIRVLGRADKYVDAFPSDGLSLGKAIKALVTGSWEGAEREQRALSTTANPAAGVLVPNTLSATVIDKARNASVLFRAGAQTVVMDSSTLMIARVDTDPTVEVKGENAAFTGSDAQFSAIEMTAVTLGIFLTASRELISDAPNSAQLLEDILSAKLAEKIDYYGLRGSGGAEPLGLINFANVNTSAVGGSIDFDNIFDGMTLLEADNHKANGYAISPTNMGVLRKLKGGDGHFLRASDFMTLPAFVTSNMPDSTALVADFSKVLVGLRQGATVEISTDAGAAFQNHQVFVKVTWRGAFNVTDANALATLTGIS